MKCVIKTSKGGAVRVSRFRAMEMEMGPASWEEIETALEAASDADFCDMESRRTTPLRLSAALKSRLAEVPRSLRAG